MRKRGLFVTLEGPEGAGKSTHARMLGSWLRREGYPVLVTREPGGTPLGQRLRGVLLNRRTKIDPFAELCLYEASREALVSGRLRPALRAGKVCIVDRFQDSTWVYQGWAGGMNRSLIEKVGLAVTGGLKPDVTILLDLPVERGLARVKRPNRMEAKPLSFHRKVRQGYLFLAHREPRRFRVVRADESRRKVQEKIREIVGDVLAKHYRA